MSKMSLEERCAKDPDLLQLYKKKLLIPGWAGELDRVELNYIKSQLRQLPSLKRRWGFRPSAKRFSESRIRLIAMDGRSAIGKPVLASAARDKRRSK